MDCSFWLTGPLKRVRNPFARTVDVPATFTDPTASGDLLNDEKLHLFESVHVDKNFHGFMGIFHKYPVIVETSTLSLERMDYWLCIVVGLLSATEEHGWVRKDYMRNIFTICYL